MTGFLKLSAEYEAEQRELEEKVKADQQVDIVFNFVGEINFLSATQPKRQGA